MTISGCISKGLRKFDLFATHQFIRYKGQPSFKTATGGFMSLAIIIIIIIVSSNTGLKMLRKQTIISSTLSQHQINPDKLNINFEKGGSFMIAITLSAFPSLQPINNYFAVGLFQYFNDVQQNPIYFLPCTSDHFSNNQQTQLMYDRMRLNTSLCPPLGSSIKVQGSKSSETYSYFALKIMKCNSSLLSYCFSDEQFNKRFTNNDELLQLQISYINTVINPTEESYKNVYLDNEDQFYFSINNHLILSTDITNLITNTDTTIMPYQQIKAESEIAVKPTTAFGYPRLSNPQPQTFVAAYYIRSSETYIYTRRFYKLDDYFSYVGGFIGTIVAVFFVMRAYSESAYLISIAEKIFNYDGNNDIHSKGFNMYYYFKMIFKQILNLFDFKGRWEKTDMFIKSSYEMAEQLNIQLLLERLSFLEEGISSILDEHQIEALYLKDKRPILKAQFTRKKHLQYRNMISDILSKMKIGSINIDPNHNIEPGLQTQKIMIPSKNEEVQYKQMPRPTNVQNSIFTPEIIQSPMQDQPPNETRQSLDQIKMSLLRLIQQGEKGDPTSRKILGRASQKILSQIGVNKGEYSSKLKKSQPRMMQQMTCGPRENQLQIEILESISQR